MANAKQTHTRIPAVSKTCASIFNRAEHALTCGTSKNKLRYDIRPVDYSRLFSFFFFCFFDFRFPHRAISPVLHSCKIDNSIGMNNKPQEVKGVKCSSDGVAGVISVEVLVLSDEIEAFLMRT